MAGQISNRGNRNFNSQHGYQQPCVGPVNLQGCFRVELPEQDQSGRHRHAEADVCLGQERLFPASLSAPWRNPDGGDAESSRPIDIKDREGKSPCTTHA